jgi:hypothetical protein
MFGRMAPPSMRSRAMQFRSISFLLSFLLLAAGSRLHAQAPGRGPTEEIDPSETQFQTGLDDIDPATVASLPLTPAYRAFLPASVDLSSHLPAPGNQGKAGACTAWAVAYAARGYYTAALENRDIHLRKNIVSPNYVYTLAKQLQNKKHCEPGSNLYALVEVLKKGALSLLDYPYHDSDCDDPPAPETANGAVDFRVRGLRLVDVKVIDDVKGALAQSQPVVIEFHDGPTWQRHREGGVFNDVVFDATKETWHAMTLVGYDERRQAFKLINSWGRGWGDHGYAWLGYDAFSARVRRAAVLEVDPPAVPPAVVTIVEPPKPVAQPKPIEKLNPIEKEKPAPLPKPVAIQPPAPNPIPAPSPRRNPEISDLETLSCAKVDVLKVGGRNILAGFVGSNSDLDLVKRVAAAVADTSLGEITLAPWPQCEAMQTLEQPLSVNDRPSIDVGLEQPHLVGETLKITVRSPPQISYLYVSYIQADGSVVHLVQPEGMVAQPTLPNQTLVFGDGKDGRATFTISAPLGREMVIAIASRSPLFAAPLPAKQTEREYLTALRQALAYRPSPTMPPRELSAAIKTLQTAVRTP